MKENEVKGLTPIKCPHCEKDIVIETVMGQRLVGVFSIEMLEESKKETVKRIEELNISEESKKSVIDWVQNPETLFSPNDVDLIIQNLGAQEGEAKKESGIITPGNEPEEK